MIKIGVFDEHVITGVALCHLLGANDEFDVVSMNSDYMLLIDQLKSEGINVLIMNMHAAESSMLNIIRQISLSYERIRVLVISHTNDEMAILKSIKSGAKGFLAKESDYNELTEAIYTLRNGYDFYSSSVAHLLLNKYITSMKDDTKMAAPGIDTLSSRQIEILKMWGNSFSNQEIAEKLFLSVRTVESHKTHIMQKLNLK